MIKENVEESFTGGITTFDAYSNWMDSCPFGRTILYPDGVIVKKIAAQVEITEEEKNTIIESIQQNVTGLDDRYPKVTFYYFFTPYSIQWWQSLVEEGSLDKQIEAEKIIIQEILKHENIKLFSFNCLTNITTDLNNYKDISHYREWINSLILRYISEDKCRITDENYQSYLSEEKDFYSNDDYAQLNNQEDYVNDYYAAILLNEEIYGTAPFNLDLKNSKIISMVNAEVVSNQHDGKDGILCTGSLQRSPGSVISVGDYIRDTEYIGFKYSIDDLSQYNYLVFYGKKSLIMGS